jgi:hypothetical protein
MPILLAIYIAVFHLFQSTTLTDAQGQCLALAPVRSVLARSGILAATLRRYSAGLSFVKRRKTSRKRRSSLKPHSEATRVSVRFRGSARSDCLPCNQLHLITHYRVLLGSSTNDYLVSITFVQSFFRAIFYLPVPRPRDKANRSS